MKSPVISFEKYVNSSDYPMSSFFNMHTRNGFKTFVPGLCMILFQGSQPLRKLTRQRVTFLL